MPRTRAADWDDSPGRRTVRQLIRMAEEDPDRVSIFSVGPDDRKETADLAVIVLFGRDELRLFRDWAERSGLLTPGADIPEYVRDAGDMFIEEGMEKRAIKAEEEVDELTRALRRMVRAYSCSSCEHLGIYIDNINQAICCEYCDLYIGLLSTRTRHG